MSSEGQHSSTEGALSGGTIVVVSGFTDDLGPVRRALQAAGHRVLSFPGGASVAGLVATTVVDCLIIERHPAGDDGLLLCKALKADPATAAPIILLADSEDRDTRVAAYRAGADDFFARPLEPDLLLARIESLMERRRATVRLEDPEGLLSALARTVEMHDAYTSAHLERLRKLSGQLALTLTLDRSEVEAVRLAGLLHDVGKIGVRSEILRKPGPLNAAEMREMQQHPEYGETIVRPLRLGHLVAPMVRGHHERFDGAGYPDGRLADEIPVGARIISVVDAFDAMTTDRPYRTALRPVEARIRLLQNAGSQFDPEVVAAFLSLPSMRHQLGL